VWTGLMWLRRGACGRLLWTWQWTFRSHKIQGIYWLAVELAASQEACTLHGAWGMNETHNCCFSVADFIITAESSLCFWIDGLVGKQNSNKGISGGMSKCW
jgi:hypothetical protein